MANQQYEMKRYYADPRIGTRTTLYHYDTSRSSPRENGKIIFQANPHYWVHRREELFSYSPDFEFSGACRDAATPIVDLSSSLNPTVIALRNNVLARFTGKVRQHNAALGVSLGSMGQSRDMINDRVQKIHDYFTEEVRRARKLKPKQLAARRRKAIGDRASDFLEAEFGWAPVLSDIRAGIGALAREPKPGWTHASSRARIYVEEVNIGPEYAYDAIKQIDGEIRCTVAARVSYENPNVHLANRLGLLALPGVAWDLVPWSFLVNMITNMGQIVNSITDFIGVTMDNGSTTDTSTATRTDFLFAGRAPGQYPTSGWARSTVHEKLKYRGLGLPSPTFQMRVPEMNLELGGILISLILQKMGTLNRIFKGSNPQHWT